MFSNELHKEIYTYIEHLLRDNDSHLFNGEVYHFRTRAEHIMRVYRWSGRLTEGLTDIDVESLQIAALFHDAGYCFLNDKRPHALVSKEICTAYMREKGFNQGLIDQVGYLVENQ